MRRLLGIMLLSLALAGCGFEPVYQQRGEQQLDVIDALALIRVQTPLSRDGDQLKAELEDLFYQSQRPKQSPRYALNVTLETQERPFIIDPDGISSRFDLVVTSLYRLTRLSDETTLDSGHVRRYVSYNVAKENDYATYISQKDAKRRAIRALAEEYQQQIAALIARAMQDAP